ncbi:MAG: hypothetical protein ACRD3Q_15665, partial [Terriglobales bacterium]
MAADDEARRARDAYEAALERAEETKRAAAEAIRRAKEESEDEDLMSIAEQAVQEMNQAHGHLEVAEGRYKSRGGCLVFIFGLG